MSGFCMTCKIPIRRGTHCIQHRPTKKQVQAAIRASAEQSRVYRYSHAGWWKLLPDHERADWLRERARSV